MNTYPAKHVSISINKPVDEIYAFASNPENLPKWAAGLSGAIRKEGDDWIADSPMGSVKVAFAAQNNFGILDHHVTLPSGVKVYVPLRVIQNKAGSEVIFTLFQLADMSQEQFTEDAKMVERDLRKLKEVLENLH